MNTFEQKVIDEKDLIIAELQEKVMILMENCARVEINQTGMENVEETDWMRKCMLQAQTIENSL